MILKWNKETKEAQSYLFLKSCMVLWTLGLNPFATIVKHTRIYVPDRQGCVVRISHEQHMCKTWILWWRKLTGLL